MSLGRVSSLVTTVVGRVLTTRGLMVLLLLLGRIRGVSAVVSVWRIRILSIRSRVLSVLRLLSIPLRWVLLVFLLVRRRAGRVRIVRWLAVWLLLLLLYSHGSN
jgi:hypothetical protein